MPAQCAGRHVGQHAAAADQARLLPDHRDVQPRPPQRSPAARRVGAVQPDLAGGRRQRRLMQRSNVVLPQPLPPSTTTSSPGVDRQV